MRALLQVMVFFSSCAAVKFHSELLNYIDMPVKDIHGKQKQVFPTTEQAACPPVALVCHCSMRETSVHAVIRPTAVWPDHA